MEQEWFEMPEVRRRTLATAVWIPLRVSEYIEKQGTHGRIGYREQFHGVGTLAVPLARRRDAEALDWTATGPGVQLADFKIPQLQLKVQLRPPAVRSNDPATTVCWSEVQLPKELRERVPEYRLEHPNPACRSEWTRACSCDLPPACRETLEDASASEHRHQGRFLRIRFQSRHGG